MTITPVVALIGALDTKGHEYAYVRDQIVEAGCGVVIIDSGVLGEPQVTADISREAVAEAGGSSLEALRQQQERGSSMTVMAGGAATLARNLQTEGKITGMLAIGGSNAAFIMAKAAADMPIGFPKMLVSTMAAGDTRPYVGNVDLTLMNPVVDINGLNHISRRVLSNAAAAIAAMAKVASETEDNDAPVVVISMFGVTTPCGARLAEGLERQGREALTFHATGAGGQAMEAVIRSGGVNAVADMTTTELADDLVGGVCSAGPERLTAAGEMGIPQVISLGALDMVNFGSPESVPKEFADRTFYNHNPEVTLMRTNAAECAEIGRRLARKLNASTGPVTVLIPMGGFSMISVPGQPFHDPEADAALIDSFTAELNPEITVRRLDADINDPSVADAAIDILTQWTGDTDESNA